LPAENASTASVEFPHSDPSHREKLSARLTKQRNINMHVGGNKLQRRYSVDNNINKQQKVYSLPKQYKRIPHSEQTHLEGY
jgi:hypothetical protein